MSKEQRLEAAGRAGMTPYLACGIAEGFEEGNPQTAWQYLHDSGMAYQLQGFYGRTARDLIERGEIEQ